MQIILTKRNQWAVAKTEDAAKALRQEGFVTAVHLADDADAKAYVKSAGIKGRQRK